MKTRVLWLLACACLASAFACSGAVVQPSPPASTKVSTVARSTMATSDGVSLAYEVRGVGEVALVFVHCWACDRSFFRDQLDVFDDEFQVVALDLPGHGMSGRREGGRILDLGEDVARLVRALDLKDVILIGHSMGGPVSLAAAARLPGTVKGVVCLDTLHNAELVPPPEMVEQMTAAFAADFEATMEGFVRSAFPPTASPETVDWVVQKALSADRATALELIRDFPTLDLTTLFEGAGVPIRCINAAPRGPGGTTTETEINRRHADFDAEVVEDVGHFLLLENPEEINPRIRRYLEELAKR